MFTEMKNKFGTCMQRKGKTKWFLEAHGWIITEERSVEKENPAGIEESSDLQRKLYLDDHKVSE